MPKFISEEIPAKKINIGGIEIKVENNELKFLKKGKLFRQKHKEIILTSPSGIHYKVYVDDSGNLKTKRLLK